MSFDNFSPAAFEVTLSTYSLENQNFKMKNFNKTIDSGINRIGIDSPQSKSNAKIQDNNLFLTIAIELIDGQEEIIPVYKGDTPRRVARKFIVNHSLQEELQEALIESIWEKIKYAEEHSLKNLQLVNNNRMDIIAKEETKIEKSNKLSSSVVQDIQIIQKGEDISKMQNLNI